jgi:S1-C subfamily serine protease
MKFLILSLVIFLSSCNFLESYNIENATVMITNLSSNSGGSGSVIYRSSTMSKVLTNRHVCEVTKDGGLIHSPGAGVSQVVSYIESETHDLCVITVADDLKASVLVANRLPELYENATISGHPHLLPTVVTKGVFGSKQTVQVAIGERPCTDEEKDSPTFGLFCAILGRLPIIKSYESTLVSATIQPGSSGSGVFNDDGELETVVFAGSGDFGYAETVPHEYVVNFLEYEMKTLRSQYPANLISLGNSSRSSKEYKKKVEAVCNEVTEKTQETICELLEKSTNKYEPVLR